MSSPRLYRLAVLVSPQASKDDRTALTSLLTSWASERGGDVHSVTTEEKRKLAFPVRAQGQAALLRASLRASPEDIRDLTTRLARETAVLRSRVFRGAPTTGKRIQDVPVRKPGADVGKADVKASPRKEKAPLEKLEEKIDEILKEEVL